MKNLGFKIYLANFWFVSSSFASFIPRKLLPARTFWQNASTYFNCLAPRDCHSLGDWLPDCRSVCLSLTESGSISGYFYYLRFFIWDSATCSLLRFRLNQRQFLHLHLHDGDTSFSLSIFFFAWISWQTHLYCALVSRYLSMYLVDVGAALYTNSDRLIDWVQISRSEIYLWFAIRNLHGPTERATGVVVVVHLHPSPVRFCG